LRNVSRRHRRRECLILASGPVLGTGAGAITNLITSNWNWWLFGSLVVLVSMAAAGATRLPLGDGGDAEPTPDVPEPICTLPAASSVFSGRSEQLRLLAAPIGTSGNRAVICLITGNPGSGKTELAVQAAHQLTAAYPDGQLFLDFRSHAGEAARLDIQDILVNALLAVGPVTEQNTLDVDRLASSWRAATRGKRLLLVLDDFVEASDLLRLLPASARCLVIATSRQFVTGVDPDLHLRIGGLTASEAEQMITEIIRRASRPVDGETIRSLASIYRLPLTVRHAADQLVSRAEGIGPAMRHSREPDSTLALFRSSIAALSPVARLVFRGVALYPGAHATAESVGALAGLPTDQVVTALAELHRLGLIYKPDPYGYGLHDLVRVIALEGEREQDDVAAARARLFTLMSKIINKVAACISAPVITGRPPDSTTGAVEPADETAALRWTSIFFDDLRAVIRLAIEESWPQTWQLTSGMTYYMRIQRNIAQAAELNESAMQICLFASDRLGQAVCHAHLGTLARVLSDYPGARRHIEAAFSLFATDGDATGQAHCHSELGIIEHHQAAYAPSREHAERAAALYAQVGNKRGTADSEGMLGMLGRLTGDYIAARDHLDRALVLFTEIGNDRNQAWIRIELGTIDRQTGNHSAALTEFDLAHEISVRTGDPNGQAWAERELGIVYRMTGNYPRALDLLSRALQTFTALEGQRNTADAHVELGTLFRVTGDLAAAQHSADQALSIYQAIGNRRGGAWAELELGVLDRLREDLSGARARFKRALSVYEEIGDLSGYARTHLELGILDMQTGDRADARHHWELAQPLYEAMGTPEAAQTSGRLAAL
jgi:tetratricopeptide (TPR) repeat protein